MKLIKNTNKLHAIYCSKNTNKLYANYCSKMESVIAFLEKDDSPPVPAEVLVEIAMLLKSAHMDNINCLMLMSDKLVETNEAPQN